MTSLFLNLFRVKWIKPGLLFDFGFKLLTSLLNSRGKALQTNLAFYKFTNSISNRSRITKSPRKMSVSIYFVATDKDFDILPMAVACARKSVPHFDLSTCGAIVPDSAIDAAKTLFNGDASISIISEDSILNKEILGPIKLVFKGRTNWIYQQLLKISLVQNCASDYCLIVDADTLLLSPRNWVDQYSRIGIMPTDEYNPDYFEFLTRLQVIDSPPKSTFIPHHMFYDVGLFRIMLDEIGLSNMPNFINAITTFSNKESASPISIDYDLFGQWISNNRPNNVVKMKWSNLSLPKRVFHKVVSIKYAILFLSLFYNSLSFHDYSE